MYIRTFSGRFTPGSDPFVCGESPIEEEDLNPAEGGAPGTSEIYRFSKNSALWRPLSMFTYRYHGTLYYYM